MLTLIFLLAGCGFECGGEALDTVPGAAVCDGAVDCWGGQDERTEGCETALFFCDQPEPQAIEASQRCDGVEDCGDGADELGCAAR
ncbi:MAG: LDL receptor domain-containing protein [Deltaproteobacteria bacterium]|nr:LDL receptor domain-containing protein [Deltaproteobacteria bacterium]